MLIQRPSGPTAEKFQRSFWEEHVVPKGRLKGIRVHRFSISRPRQPSRPEQALNAAPVPIQQNWSRLSFESACRENTSPKGVSRFKKASEAGNLPSLKTVPNIDENEREEASITTSIPKFTEIVNRSPAGKLARRFEQKSVIPPTEKKKSAGDVRKAGKTTQTPTHTTREAMENQIEYHTKALKGHMKELGDCVYKLACYDSYHVVPTVPKDDESPMSHASIQDLVRNQMLRLKTRTRHLGKWETTFLEEH
jgi:hypothetical protein